MRIADLRKSLDEIRRHAAKGEMDEVRRAADDALHQLDGEQLLTTTQAAELLGIGSVNTLKLLVRRLQVPHERHGNRMMIPLSELERIQDSPDVRNIRASDRAHEAIAGLGSARGLTVEQLAELEQARPGRLPWKTRDASIETGIETGVTENGAAAPGDA